MSPFNDPVGIIKKIISPSAPPDFAVIPEPEPQPQITGEDGGAGGRGGTPTPETPVPITPSAPLLPPNWHSMSGSGTSTPTELQQVTPPTQKGILTPIVPQLHTAPVETPVAVLQRRAEQNTALRIQEEQERIINESRIFPGVGPIPPLYDTKKIEQQTKDIYQQEYAEQGLRFIPLGGGSYRVLRQGQPTYEEWWKNIQSAPAPLKYTAQASMAVAYGAFNPSYWANVFTGNIKGSAEEVKRYAYGVEDIRGHGAEYLDVFRSPAYTQVVYPTLAFKGFFGGLGYLKGLGPVGATISGKIGTGVGIVMTKEMVQGGVEAYGRGSLPKYAVETGINIGVLQLGTRGAFKSGELAGMRKRILSNVVSTTEKARVSDIYAAIDMSKGLSSKDRMVLDLNKVENLRGNVEQQIALKNAMRSSEMQKYKVGMGGSGVQPTYGLGTSPHDIDMYVKPSVIRPLIKDISSTEILRIKPEKNIISNVESIKSIMKNYGVNLELFDIHDLPTKGSSFPQRSTGFTESLIKTPKESTFKYQTTLSEQAGRKFASTLAPLHEMRGKDWTDALSIAEKTFRDKELYARLEKWKPQTEPGTGKLIGPSYYEMYPSEAPKIEFTWFEKKLQRYGGKVTSSDLFTPEAMKSFVKPEAEPFRPKFVEKQTVPRWAKGTLFLSAVYPFDTTTKSGYLEKGLLLGSKYFAGGIQKNSYPIYTTEKIRYPAYPSNRTGYTFSTDLYPSGGYPTETPGIKYPTEIKYPSYPKTSYTPSYPPIRTPSINYPSYPPNKKYPSYYPSQKYTPSVPTKTKYNIIPDIFQEKRQPEKVQGFDVFVKERSYLRGKKRYPESWRKANKKPLTEHDALSLGGSAIDNSAAATFKIRPASNKKARPLNISVSDWDTLNYKFYKKGNRVIEKTGSRIDTQGELMGISALGWIANQKKIRGGINFGW